LRYAFFGAQKLNDTVAAEQLTKQIEAQQQAQQQQQLAPPAGLSAAERAEKERLLRRALPDAQAAATNWIHSNGMYGKPPSRFIRDITRILFDPNELASNRVTTLDKKWVSVICREAIDAYPNHAHATSGAVRNIISTMCSEARVSLGYSKSKNHRKKLSPQVTSNTQTTTMTKMEPTPSSSSNVASTASTLLATSNYSHLVKKAIAEASHIQQSCLN
jgi:hypothetical protein